MKIEQLYTACLAQGAYFIESNGEAAVIDPMREVDNYIALATARNAKIKYIFETHFHADFVSGHVDLAQKTGAKIVYGPTKMKTGFECIIAQDNTIFNLGKVKIKLIHTPGHTLESACYLLYDENGKEHSLFTGDTLFIGDVGRPDLAQHVVQEWTQEKLANLLYDSLRNKILTLPDHITIYPGHGAGSACGKNLSSEKFDSLGHQKLLNYALQPNLSREDFVAELLDGLTAPPAYFPKNVMMNMQGYDALDGVMQRGTKMISLDDFIVLTKQEDVFILDARDPKDFALAHIPGSINIGINGNFAVWVGTIIQDVKKKIAIVGYQGNETEVITRLARVGFDYALGFLDGGFQTWKKAGLATKSISSITVDEFASRIAKNPYLAIIDVRKKSEFDAEHLDTAENLPLDYYEESLDQLDKNKTYHIHCAGGYRSMIYISLLEKAGYNNLVDVQGGFNEIKASNQFQTTEFVAQNTML